MTDPITRPQGGGSYVKRPDGSLVQVEAPALDEKARAANQAVAAQIRREAEDRAIREAKAAEKAASQAKSAGVAGESKE